VKLLEQPGDGVKPLVQAMDRAKERIEIAIFRFDRSELEKAMIRAVGRGVFVHALIAYTNRGGEKNLRQLEMRLLEHGVNVARTADDLVRYHGKFMIVDRKELFVLGFNFTYLDMEHSRSFGLITHDSKLLKEAVNLFDADTKRQAYEAGSSQFIVSPVNARSELASFISGAKKELAIYDPKIADPRMIRLLEERAAAGVEVRILGKLENSDKLPARELTNIRLHVRSMVRDRQHVFLGSQSLRAAELETRREVGVLLKNSKIAARILKVFDEDWLISGEHQSAQPQPAVKAARKVAKAMAKSLPSVDSVLEAMATDGETRVEVDSAKLEEALKVAVKQAVEQSVLAAVEDASELAPKA
jgi:phosphatidylserine/phosphatidylglycerophosphate/cardiolipin synthase-like enzyme